MVVTNYLLTGMILQVGNNKNLAKLWFLASPVEILVAYISNSTKLKRSKVLGEHLLVGGWTTPLVKLDHVPKLRGENKKHLSCHHRVYDLPWKTKGKNYLLGPCVLHHQDRAPPKGRNGSKSVFKVLRSLRKMPMAPTKNNSYLRLPNTLWVFGPQKPQEVFGRLLQRTSVVGPSFDRRDPYRSHSSKDSYASSMRIGVSLLRVLENSLEMAVFPGGIE